MSDSPSSSSSQAAPSKRRRLHTSRACERCRKRKIKCDGNTPCDVCVRVEIDCHYSQSRDRRVSAKEEANRAVLDRLASLESLIKEHGIDVSRLSNGAQSNVMSTAEPISTNQWDWTQPSDSTDDFLQSLEPSLLPDLSPRVPVAATSMPPPAIILPPSAPIAQPASRADPPFSSIRSRTTSFERLQRRGDEGRLLQFGETSLFTHLPSEADARPSTPSPPSNTLPDHPLQPARLEWSQHLPPTLNIDKDLHDRALDHFASYWAPWCMVVDVPPFLRDLVTCNMVNVEPRAPRRTAHYSPLLHCVVLFMGMYYGRSAWPEAMERYKSTFMQHCQSLTLYESTCPTLSTIRGLNLYATCVSEPPMGHASLGYVNFGSAIAMSQVIGLNVPCDSYVAHHQVTADEKRLRDNTYWAVYLYDILRSVAAGRPPLLAAPVIDLPEINDETDQSPWVISANPIPSPATLGRNLHGLPSLRSTVFHWCVRLAKLQSEVRATLYPTVDSDTQRDERVQALSLRLEEWKAELPKCISHPETYPLPHVLLLHMFYHLVTIFLYRPFYRTAMSSSPSPSSKCDQAADRILQLLQLYDLYHSVRYGPGTLINIMFSTTTVFFMRAVEEQNQGLAISNEVRKGIDNMFAYMGQLSHTFWEAGRGVVAALALCADWLPGQFDIDALGADFAKFIKSGSPSVPQPTSNTYFGNGVNMAPNTAPFPPARVDPNMSTRLYEGSLENENSSFLNGDDVFSSMMQSLIDSEVSW